ncbi:MAG: FAD:protein FMN transferase [Acidobacteriota bacterium]
MSAVRPWSSVVFRAMGSPCRIVAPNHELARHGRDLVLELERTWTRFDPSSEVCELNDHAGRLTIVSPVTYELVSLAEQARSVTGGAFNPLLLDHLVDLGYDRTWEQVDRTGSDLPPVRAVPVEPIELHPEIRAVRLPSGTRFDPGGIGKGMAGDMVAAALLDAGAESVQIELGGDVRVAGPSWTGGPWQVLLDDSDHGRAHPATISLAGGGVATSTIMRRRWRRGGVDVHHLIDVDTGRSAVSDLDTATVVGPNLWWSEVVAKLAVIGGSVAGRALLEELGMPGLLVRRGVAPRYDLVAREEVA